MTPRIRIASALALVVVVAALAFAAASAEDKAADKKMAKPAPAASIGKVENAKWSATTMEAAASEANKKVLASGKPATVTGEVVDVSCYLELGKRGPAHVACGTKCINNGAPIGLVDAQDHLYLLFAEPHHPRRDGEAPIKDMFLPYLSQTVKVSGMMTDLKGGMRALFVEPAGMTAPSGDGGMK